MQRRPLALGLGVLLLFLVGCTGGSGTLSSSYGVSGSQFVDLVFTSPWFQQVVVSNVMAPGPSGISSLSSPVVLVPLQVTLSGQVVDSTGYGPTGVPSQVVIVETGQAATPVAGSYSLVGVPVGLPLTLRASVVSALGVEQGVAYVTPVGSGTFQVPTIVTSP